MSNKKMLNEMFDEQYNEKKMKEEILNNFVKNEKKKVSYFKWALVPVCVIAIVLLVSLKQTTKSITNENIDKNKDYNTIDTNPNNPISKNDDLNGKHIIQITDGYEDSSDGIFYDMSDLNVLAKKSDAIAIVRIDSIDGCTKRYRISNKKAGYIFTYGNASVLKAIQGDIKNNEFIYKKPGGRLPYLEWVEADTDPEKLLSMVRANGNKINGVPVEDVIVEEKRKDDIEITEGKIYLAFMMKSFEYSDDFNEYAFIGRQYGLREIKNYDIKNKTLSGVKVKNNKTGKWEDISKVIDLISNK